MAISKTLFFIESKFKICEKIMRCAVEETGMNSVKPSIIPSKIALKKIGNSSTLNKNIVKKLGDY